MQKDMMLRQQLRTPPISQEPLDCQLRWSCKGETADHASAEGTQCWLEEVQLAELPAAVDAQLVATRLCKSRRQRKGLEGQEVAIDHNE